MKSELKLVKIKKDGNNKDLAVQCDVDTAKKVRQYHKSFTEYAPTPLVKLSNLAKALDVAEIYVKDESKRFDLNAFKVLGGSYAIGRYIADELNLTEEEMNLNYFLSPEIQEKIKEKTFITATDGNHGRGVAWTADRLGCKSVVYMPKGTVPERLENIKKLGSDASITELIYDEAVEKAFQDGKKNGWTVVQDTAWDDYEEIPSWIMQGYLTIGDEIYEAMKENEGRMATHIFLQAGVGTMAGGMTAFFTNLYKDLHLPKPTIVIVEALGTECINKTAEENDGKLHSVTERMSTIMAGLACGTPCSLAWDILKKCADFCLAIPDGAAANGMRVLANPLGDDEKVVAGESGASGFGAVMEVLRNPNYAEMKSELGLDKDSRILCISTEGDTDRENYRRIVWDGAYSI